jgi:hypothetical protein
MIETENTFGTTTIYCDGCDEYEEFEGIDTTVDIQKAFKEAKEYGWEILDCDEEGPHYCRVCANTK